MGVMTALTWMTAAMLMTMALTAPREKEKAEYDTLVVRTSLLHLLNGSSCVMFILCYVHLVSVSPSEMFILYLYIQLYFFV